MEIKLYTAKGCPKCKVLKEKLDNQNIKYVSVDSCNALNEGIKTVPILEVDGVRMGMI